YGSASKGSALSGVQGQSPWPFFLHESGFSPVGITPAMMVSASRLRSALDSGDLGSFNADPDHQPLLIEDEGVSVILQRRCGKILGNALVHNDDRRPHAEFPSLGTMDVAYCLVAHQKHDV